MRTYLITDDWMKEWEIVYTETILIGSNALKSFNKHKIFLILTDKKLSSRLQQPGN